LGRRPGRPRPITSRRHHRNGGNSGHHPAGTDRLNHIDEGSTVVHHLKGLDRENRQRPEHEKKLPSMNRRSSGTSQCAWQATRHSSANRQRVPPAPHAVPY
jgi:hypothetical protein